MRAIFTDKGLQAKFESEGFVQVPLLNSAEIRTLQALYERVNAGNEQPFYTSIWSDSREHREEVNRELQQVLLPAVDRRLDRCKPVFSNFMVKRSGEHSRIGLHQDWNFVDETQHFSVNCWCPLVDTTPQNGRLKVVPRSHTFPPTVRGRGIRSPYDPIQAEIRADFMEELAVPAGTAVIFDERLLHASEDNLSGKDRVAVSLVMAPKEAQLLHFIRRSEEAEHLDKLEVGPEFFTKFGLFDSLEEVAAASRIPYVFEGFSATQFAEMVRKAQHSPGFSLKRMLSKIFS